MRKKAKRRRCLECESHMAKYEDPRKPPLDTGDGVLCAFCYAESLQELIRGYCEDIEDCSSRLESVVFDEKREV